MIYGLPCLKNDISFERVVLKESPNYLYNLEKSDVFIVCPGGVGTMDEFFDFITLRELERHSKKIILFSINHFYDFLFSLLLKMNYEGIIDDKTIKMIEVAHTIDELFKLL